MSTTIPRLTATLTGTGAIAVSQIVIDPATPATLYAGLDGKGIYKSTNSGLNWTEITITTSPANKRIKALVIKPGDSTRLFAAVYGSGVYWSMDSGGTWSGCPAPGMMTGRRKQSYQKLKRAEET
ncbi:MAG: hypothetical protein V1844_14850 [Pseudomonadota bacterium]